MGMRSKGWVVVTAFGPLVIVPFQPSSQSPGGIHTSLELTLLCISKIGATNVSLSNKYDVFDLDSAYSGQNKSARATSGKAVFVACWPAAIKLGMRRYRMLRYERIVASVRLLVTFQGR
jgi:hypothetical protein